MQNTVTAVDKTNWKESFSPAMICLGIVAAGSIAILIGGVWLIIWLSGLGAQWSASGALTVKTNAALGLVMAGLALLLLSPEKARGWRWWSGVCASLLVLLIGSLTFSQHLFGWDLGIDQLLATEAPGAIAVTSPNRMGPPASLCLSLLGVGLLLLALKRRAVVPYLGLAVILTNLIPAVGFLYGINVFYEKPSITGIAWPTVVALITLGIGLVMSWCGGGPMLLLLRGDPGGVLLRRMLPVVVLVPLALGFVEVQAEYKGLFNAPTGSGLLVISLILIFSAILWWSADGLSRSAKAKQEAESRLAWLASFPERNPMPVVELDIDGYVYYGNEASRELFPAANAKQHDQPILPDWKPIVETLQQDPSVLILREMTVGNRFYQLMICYLEDIKRIRIYGADISKRKHAEEALLKTEEQKRAFYRRTILAATDGNLVITEPEEIRKTAGPSYASWDVGKPEVFSTIRRVVTELAEKSGMSTLRINMLITSVGEAVSNAYKHAHGGTASVHQLPDRVFFMVEDKGKGIEALNLPDVALVRGYSTAGTLGMGYKLMIMSSDKVYLATGPSGTVLGIEMEINEPHSAVL